MWQGAERVLTAFRGGTLWWCVGIWRGRDDVGTIDQRSITYVPTGALVAALAVGLHHAKPSHQAGIRGTCA